MKYFKSIFLFVLTLSFFMLVFTACQKKESVNMEEVKKMENEFADFKKAYHEKIKPAFKAGAAAYWDASINRYEDKRNPF